ncbi:MAG: hypothetical protein ACRYGA_05100 [Janthinobacterium lividum]
MSINRKNAEGNVTASRELRRVALTVDEPWPGLFFWVLQEEKDEVGLYEPIDVADSPVASYHDALAHGYVALQALCGHDGPRHGEDAAPLFVSPPTDFAPSTLQ